MDMLSVSQQLKRIIATATTPPSMLVSILEAQGLLCAEDITAQNDIPGFDQAALDGYAARSVDISKSDSSSDNAITLPLVGEIVAGDGKPARLQPNQAVFVESGAPIPTLADTVIPQRWVEETGDSIKVKRKVKSGANIRHRGEDLRINDLAVRAGEVITAAQIGLLAAVGRQRVKVHPRPRVTIVSVGNELIDITAMPANGQVFDINSYALAAAAKAAGAQVNRIGIVKSNPQILKEVISGQINKSELIIICGGIGGRIAGLVQQTIGELGELNLNRVAMHPGSLQGFGLLGVDKIPVFLLPLDTVSALVVFEIMIRPLIKVFLGNKNPVRKIITAKTIDKLVSLEGKLGVLRGELMRDKSTGEYVVRWQQTNFTNSLALLSGYAQSNCFILIPPDTTEVAVGETVEVIFLGNQS